MQRAIRQKKLFSLIATVLQEYNFVESIHTNGVLNIYGYTLAHCLTEAVGTCLDGQKIEKKLVSLPYPDRLYTLQPRGSRKIHP